MNTRKRSIDKEDIKQRMRDRFEAAKTSINESGTDIPAAILMGMPTHERVDKLKPGSDLDEVIREAIAAARRHRPMYLMILSESKTLKVEKLKLEKEGLTEALIGILRFADGYSMGLMAEIKRDAGKKTVLETEELSVLQTSILPEWIRSRLKSKKQQDSPDLYGW